MNNLDIIFTRNYEEIIELANQIELFQSSLSQVFKKLSLNIEFILLLLKLRFQLTENAYNIIKQALVSEYGDQDSEMNWEEITYANIGFLIRSMNKKDRDSSALVSLHVVDDIEKFKKHLTLFIDKISKGGLENFEIFDHEPKNNEVSENNFQQKKNLKKNI